MEQRMAVTALYLFRGLSPEKIRHLPISSPTPRQTSDPGQLRRTPEEVRNEFFPSSTLEQVKDLLGPAELGWEDKLLMGLARERSVLNRWIREITRLLKLEEVRRRRIKSQRKPGRTEPRV